MKSDIYPLYGNIVISILNENRIDNLFRFLGIAAWSDPEKNLGLHYTVVL